MNKVSKLKLDKKERIIRKQKSRAILVRNKKINKINIFVLGVGLLLLLLGQNLAGNVLIWVGVGTFVYTQLSGSMARRT